MSLGDKGATITDSQDEAMNKRKIIHLGKLMAILGAGTLALICIGLVKSGAIFSLLQ